MKRGLSCFIGMMLLSGCAGYSGSGNSSIDSIDAGFTYANVLHSHSVCCQSYRQIDYQMAMNGVNEPISITENSPVFNFSDGKAFFAAYQVAQNKDGTKEKVNLYFDLSQNLFLPKIIILDQDFKITSILDNSFIAKDPAYFIQQGVVNRQFVMGGSSRKYFIVYTPVSLLKQSFKVETEKAIFNRKHAYAPPPMGLRYKQIRFSQFGSFDMSINNLVTSDLDSKTSEQSPRDGASHRRGYMQFMKGLYSPKPLALQIQERQLRQALYQALKTKQYEKAFRLYRKARAQGVNAADRIFLEALNQAE
ncbi:MAG: hypothetical protein CENE_00773 [Candidatus Celerinatantimonas neptuna]|nr:MAG: hypothetical protein CENE_00773 [Candidatus Celerinatantimonas neptuna]